MGLPARIFVLLALGLELAYIFLRLPAGAGFPNPELARMITLHLPNAYIACILAFGAGWYGIRYLRGRNLLDDARSVVAAQLAALYAFLTTATGSVFAKEQWGSYWNWDPRQTCVAALLLVYAAYFLLRASVDDPDKRAAIAAVYVLFASVLTPTLGYVIPRFFIDQSLHPKVASFDKWYRLGIYPTSLGLLMLTLWIQRLAVRGERLRLGIESLEESAA
ncbi:MAG: cytochrome c biogenesis protein CcsA [Armatimonadota bacterium]